MTNLFLYHSSENEKCTNFELLFLILFSFPSSVIGATLIILGLYATLWGKEKEKQDKAIEANCVRGKY